MKPNTTRVAFKVVGAFPVRAHHTPLYAVLETRSRAHEARATDERLPWQGAVELASKGAEESNRDARNTGYLVVVEKRR